MLVSVIVTEYNSKKLLEKCIDSLLNQTLKEMEVIIVDDNSTSPISINEKWKSSNIRYVYNEKNKGLGESRNIGMSMANGKYICFLDSDDWVDLDYYKSACYYMEESCADIGQMGIYREIDSHLNKSHQRISFDNPTLIDSNTAIHILSRKYNFGVQLSFTVTSKIFSSEFIKLNNLKFISNVYYEDFTFTFCSFLKAKNILTIPKVRYHHYKREGSIIQSFSEKHIYDFILVFQTAKQQLLNENLFELYKIDFYLMFEYYFNIIIRQLFSFTLGEKGKKIFLKLLFKKIHQIVDFDEYFDFLSAEEIRNHLQPNIPNITI